MMIYMPIAMAILGLIYMLIKKSWVMKQDAGDGKMKEISDHIYEGALAFLNAEYRLLDCFCYCSKCFTCNSIFYCTNNTLVNCSCFYFWSCFFCFCWKYGNENCN